MSALARLTLALTLATIGCQSTPPPRYGTETRQLLPPDAPRIWAIAPAVNLSGERAVDPVLQADLVFAQVQEIRGVVAVPVNRTVEAMAASGIGEITSTQQAYLLCDQLGADALLLPTVTKYDPYDPPTLGGALQLFVRRHGAVPQEGIDPRELARAATPGRVQTLPRRADFIQAADVFDAADGSTRGKVRAYAAGRFDPAGPLGERAFFQDADRYARFAWHELLDGVLRQLR